MANAYYAVCPGAGGTDDKQSLIINDSFGSDTSSDFTAISESISVSSGALHGATWVSSQAYHETSLGSPDHFVEATVRASSDFSDNSRAYARLPGTSTLTGYCFYLRSDNNIGLLRVVSGTATWLANFSVTINGTTDYKVRLRVTGTGATVTCSIWCDNVYLGSYADTDAARIISGNYVGVAFIRGSANYDATVDNLKAGLVSNITISSGVATLTGPTVYFGNQDIDGNLDSSNLGITKWNSYTCPGTGNKIITELSAFVYGASGHIRLAIYSNDRQTLIAQGSAEVLVSGATGSWQGHIGISNIAPSNARLVGGTSYQIALSFDSNVPYVYTSSDTLTYGIATSADYTEGFPSSLGDGTETLAFLWAMRCGVMAETQPQTGNIGQGFRITYGSSDHYCFISQVNSATSFNVVDEHGATMGDHVAVVVDSIKADYASLSAAEAGATDSTHLNTANLVTATTILNLVCYAGVSADSTEVQIDGYTTNSTYYIAIYSPTYGTQCLLDSNRHKGIWSDSKYVITASDASGGIIRCSDPYTVVDGLQIVNTYTGTSTNRYSANLEEIGCIIKNSILKATGAGTATRGIYNDGGYSSCKIINNIIYNFADFGIYCGNDTGTADKAQCYNNTVYGCGGVGISTSAADYRTYKTLIFNNVSYNNTGNDYGGLNNDATCSNNASQDGTAPGTDIDLSGYTAEQIWTNAANGDFSLVSNSPLLITGIGPSSDTNVPTTDIIGNPRVGTLTSIGVFHKAITNVYYSLSPFGTGDIKTGSPTCGISSGVMVLSTLIESNLTPTGYDALDDPAHMAAQGFEHSTAFSINSYRINLTYVSGSGNVTVALRTQDTDRPNTSNIAGSSVTIVGDNLSASASWLDFTLATPLTGLLANTKYYLVVYVSGSLYVQINYSGNAYADGSSFWSNNSGAAWTEYAGYDYLFGIYGIDSGSSVAQTGNIGQGSKITYDTSKIVFIKTVTDSSHFVVVDKYGLIPSDIASGTTVNSIAHNWASLSTAEAGADDSGYLNTVDLTSANVILNLTCYYDHDDYSVDSTAIAIDGWTTSATCYINVYAPIGSTQSINSQRHNGVWDSNKYVIHTSYDGNTLYVYSGYTIIDGLQVENTSYNNSWLCCITLTGTIVTGSHVKNCIVKDYTSTGTYRGGIGSNSNITNPVFITNCIAYNFSGTNSYGMGLSGDNGVRYTSLIKNCTVYNCSIGLGGEACNIHNSVAIGCTNGFGGWGTMYFCVSDVVGDITGNGCFITSQADSELFVDAANGDFNPVSGSDLRGTGRNLLFVAALTSPTGGTPSQADARTGAQGPASAIDGDSGTESYIYMAPGICWWEYDYGAGNEKIWTGISLQCGGSSYYIKNFIVQGSNDHSNYTTLLTSSHPDSNSVYPYAFSNSTAFRYYRLYNIGVTWGDPVNQLAEIAELQCLLGTAPIGTDIIGTNRSQTVSWDVGAFEYLVNLTIILEQEGFRFRNDNGSESAATWLAAQDTVILALAGNNMRLRVLINTTGSNSLTPQLEYRESPDGNNWSNWAKVV